MDVPLTGTRPWAGDRAPDVRGFWKDSRLVHAVQAEPVRGRRQITSAERTNMWSVCLTSKGVLNYLNRRISPVGENGFPSRWRQCSFLIILPDSTGMAARLCAGNGQKGAALRRRTGFRCR